ncbi:phage baseplate protein [Pseudomonas oryzihabitans]|uniref:phage baseplate protein n=1 Tax=Pseudomonas oryzihabitans TaxID=47885 RepID=UPI0011A4CBF5|nr:hypothetical protein [Pseudomonas psychrotolerans]
MFGLKISTNIDDESQFLLFDTVITYSKSLTGQVTKNPIAGSSVTSNFTAENPTFSFTGVISYADLGNSTLFRDEDGGIADNVIEQPSAVKVNESSSTLTNLIPSSISQFLPQSNANVSMDSARTNYKDFVDVILQRLMSGEVLDEATGRMRTAMRTNTLYEFDALGAIIKLHKDLVLTSYSVKEDESTGDSLVCDLTFEKVKFVKLRTSALPKDVVDGLKKKSTVKQNKGTINSKKTTQEIDQKDELYGVLKPKSQSATEYYSR